MKAPAFDRAVIGESVNGCGLVRNTEDIYLSIHLCKQSNLASSTSSASTKLIHNDPGYRVFCEFHPVRERLRARKVKLSPSSPLSIHSRQISTTLKLNDCRNIQKSEDLSYCFGGNIFESEVSYLFRNTLARITNDKLWRQPNPGLVITTRKARILADWMNNNTSLVKKLSH